MKLNQEYLANDFDDMNKQLQDVSKANQLLKDFSIKLLKDQKRTKCSYQNYFQS